MPNYMHRRFRSVSYALTLVLALALAVASTVAASQDSDWRLMVRSAACVQGPHVLLGEIADPVRGVDERTWQTLSKVKLWKASNKVGRPVTVGSARLKKILKYYLGDKVDNLILPNQITVQTGGSVVTGRELRTRVVDFLTLRAKDLGGNIEIKNLKLPMHYFFKNESDKLKLGLARDIRPGRNRIRMKAVSAAGRTVSSKAGTVFINVWKAVPVAAKPLNRNEHLTRDKISFRRVNLAYKTELWDGTGGPWRMTRTLGRNQPFTMSHLEQIPLIEKGERVNLVYRNNRIRLSIKAEALNEAGKGQQVSVRNLQSKKTIVATVVDSETVMVR